MANSLYRIDLESNGAVFGHVEVLASNEEEAVSEVRTAVQQVLTAGANRGVYLRDPVFKPRRVLERGDGT